MRGVSTTPVILAVLLVAITAFFVLLNWTWSQGKASERASQFAQELASVKYACLTAVVQGGRVVVNGVPMPNYTGPGCYVDPNIVIVFETYNGTG
ncbi:MAG: hypothetical protein ACP5HD_10660 [Thermoproteus sp.]